ncbi:hypothetical protein RHE_CH01985 [Rhizobium etli CFN 42]|uniref:Uncharacterized protein n=1 Tax=Rhizobium etli (strain ATCC 51251 / DSM 11541 / JCM 21823 / NBRC 15573 / CFN 42) TaxID=347834 RepID=Q2K8R6_RHIEC|nr:hypothetical protein [Rhizobium etli]ABC90770.1 hypothetical protein RHE_CH01985 [Rhizobium etli CFN 42]
MENEIEIRKIPPFPSRALVIAAANMLRAEGHDGFDAMRLAWDLLETDAGRGSTLAARATSLATYALKNPEFRTPDGVYLQSAIVARAGDIYRSGWMTNIGENERNAFEKASTEAGSMNDVSQTGVVRSTGSAETTFNAPKADLSDEPQKTTATRLKRNVINMEGKMNNGDTNNGLRSDADRKPGFWEGVKNKVIENVGVAIAGVITATILATAAVTWAAIKKWVVIDIPSGLVIASTRECRDLAGGSWSAFDAAGGRFIIGAGGHPTNPGVTKSYAVFTNESDAPPTGMVKSTGGTESITIAAVTPPTLDMDTPDGYLRNNNPNYKAVTAVRISGGGSLSYPLESIPPYVALYYCKKN